MDFAHGAGPCPGDDTSDDVCYTVAEAAARGGVSRQTVHDWIRRGHLEAVRTDDGTFRVTGEALRRVIEMRRVATSSHFRLETVRHWVEGTADDAAGSP
jgi:excisionase family DNA binding protein